MPGIYGIPESFSEEPEVPVETTSEALPITVRHPRPDKATVEKRDTVVLELVQRAGPEGISRVVVAETLGLTMHEAYLALNRIQHTGEIRNARKNNAHIWIARTHRTEGE